MSLWMGFSLRKSDKMDKELLKEEIKSEIKRVEELLEGRVRAKDYGGALRREGELDGLRKAWQLIALL